MNQEEKCHPNGLCFHDEIDHEEGACWKITQESLEKVPTNDKFCGCIGPGNIRRFGHPKMGFMLVEELGDLMITKACSGCGAILNMRIDESLCLQCKDRPENYISPAEHHYSIKVLQEIPIS